MIPASEVRPEHRLWMAVLWNAISDLRDPIERDRARRWVNPAPNGVGSFAWICEHLGIDPVVAGKKILSGKVPLPRGRKERKAA